MKKSTKKIPLEKAYEILQDCSAVIVDDNVVTYPCLHGSKIENDVNNEFLTLSWDFEDNEYKFVFNEDGNREVEVVGSSLFLIDIEGETTQLTILEPKNLEE